MFEKLIVPCWRFYCMACDVGGAEPQTKPRELVTCWSCGGVVVIHPDEATISQ